MRPVLLKPAQLAVRRDMKISRLVSPRLLSLWVFLLGLESITHGGDSSLTDLQAQGAKIYAQSCADCHGDRGQGADGGYEDPLIGDESTGQLADLISATMPEGSPEECQGEDAQAVAEYIHYAFYSEAAQIRNRPPKITLSRLTGNQLRQSISDLYANFHGLPQPASRLGVSAEYFDGDRWRREDRKWERVDPTIDFDFGRESPGEGIKAEAFSIRWQGGILADVSGRFEIVVRSSCSFMMDFGHEDREFINNYVQSGDKTEFRRAVELTGGRVYPFQINFRQRARKTELPPANISLSWVPPGGEEAMIPNRNLVAESVPAAYALQTKLPPDDRSYGYERGIAVDREWDESTTAAAIEFAQIAYDELWPHYQRQHRRGRAEDRSHLSAFLTEIVETAFRGPLDEAQRQLFIEKQLEVEPDDAEAIKRVCLASLKSARFLYPAADLDRSESQRVANRLALVLFDSLPTGELQQMATDAVGWEEESSIRVLAEKYVDDYRVRAKARELMYAWLNAAHFGELTKDAERFPGFDAQLVNDLRLSLDAFLDQVIWSERSDFRQFFLANYSFTSNRIEQYYGDPWKVGRDANPSQEIRISEASDQHLGLLNHPYLMSGLSYHDATSPIHRGVFLIRYLLGRTLKPPAEAFSPLSPDLHPDLTTRERVSLQTSPESCQVCHAKINGLGFVLENYDAVGKFRESERQKAIDASGQYVNRQGKTINFNGPRDLAVFLAESDEAQRAFVSRAFQHFVKQPPAAYGADTLDRLTRLFQENECSIRKLIVEIAVTASLPISSDVSSKVARFP